MGRKAKKIEEQRGNHDPILPPEGYLIVSPQELDRIKGDIANLKFQMDEIKTLLGHVLSIRVKKKKKKEPEDDVLSQGPEG